MFSIDFFANIIFAGIFAALIYCFKYLLRNWNTFSGFISNILRKQQRKQPSLVCVRFNYTRFWKQANRGRGRERFKKKNRTNTQNFLLDIHFMIHSIQMETSLSWSCFAWSVFTFSVGSSVVWGKHFYEFLVECLVKTLFPKNINFSFHFFS